MLGALAAPREWHAADGEEPRRVGAAHVAAVVWGCARTRTGTPPPNSAGPAHGISCVGLHAAAAAVAEVVVAARIGGGGRAGPPPPLRKTSSLYSDFCYSYELVHVAYVVREGEGAGLFVVAEARKAPTRACARNTPCASWSSSRVEGASTPCSRQAGGSHARVRAERMTTTTPLAFWGR